MDEMLKCAEQFPTVPFWNDYVSEDDISSVYRQHSFRVGVDSKDRQQYAFSIDFKSYESLLSFAGDREAAFFNCTISSFGLLFSRYSSQKLIFLDSPCLNALSEPSENGKNVPFCCVVDSTLTLQEYVESVRRNVGDWSGNQSNNEASGNNNIAPASNIYIQYSAIHGSFQYPKKYDLIISMEQSADGLDITVDYRPLYFDGFFIQRIPQHLRSVLRAFSNLDIRLKDIDILSEEEHALLDSFNKEEVPHPHTSIVALFEEQVKRTPLLPAVVAEDGAYNYIQLCEEANKLAHYLIRECNVRQGDVVGIMTDRSSRNIIGMLAILKVGAAYLPIDPAAPYQRKQQMIEQAAATVLLTDSTHVFNLDFFKGVLFALDIQVKDLKEEVSSPGLIINAADLAYVIFTSGSTGQPKGVMIQHDSLVNLCFWHIKQFSVSDSSRATLYANVSFDASVWELWPYLLTGACIYPLEEELKRNLPDLERFLNHNSITHCFLPTPIYEEFCKQGLPVDENMFVLTGGDELKHRATLGLNVSNNYGPTESTVVATSIFLGDNSHAPLIPIGKPIDNVQALILDRELRKVPIGVEGELFLSGRGLAKGYIIQPDLTNEKFIKNPFSKQNKVMYRTGDMVCWLADGNILFKGRKDSQVKIRGYRIELGEIESQIRKSPLVEDVKVLITDDTDNNKYVCAFYIGNGGLSNELKDFVSKALPDYMIPTHFIGLEKFPLTVNGKIDTKTLLQKCIPALQKMGLMPEDEQGKEMVRIWQSVLNTTSIGLKDNFFAHGGDSIKAIRLIYDVNNSFGAKLKLVDIFKYDTPELLIERIEKTRSSISDSPLLKEIEQYMEDVKKEHLNQVVNTNEIEDVFPVADIQLGMLYHGLYGEGGSIYHDQIVHQVKYVEFEPEKFERALELMADRHGILRTGFDLKKSASSVQMVYKSIKADYDHYDISELGKVAQQEAINKFLAADRERPFEIVKPGLWRVRTFSLGNHLVVVIFICHHAIIDGWSDATFSTELNNTYRKLKEDDSYQLSKLPCSYKDYVREELITKRNPVIRDFWKMEFEKFNKTNFAFKLNDEGAENRVHNENLGAELKDLLAKFASKKNLSPRVVCFSVYLQIIRLLSVNEEVVVGLHTHNRPLHKDSDKLLGCFLNSIPVKYSFTESGTWIDHLDRVNKRILELTEFGTLSLMEIVKLHPEINKRANENSFFDTLFAYLDFHVYQNLESSDSNFSETFGLNELEVPGQGINNTFFNFIVNSTMSEFNLLIFYKSSQINTELIKYIGQQFKENLKHLLEYPHEPFERATILNDSGRGSNPEPSITFNF